LNKLQWDGKWTESIAIGCGQYIKMVKEALADKVKYRTVVEGKWAVLYIKEATLAYNAHFDGKKEGLSHYLGFIYDDL